MQVIAEGANGPTTPDAEKTLIANKTLVIPVWDFIMGRVENILVWKMTELFIPKYFDQSPFLNSKLIDFVFLFSMISW